MSKQILSNLSGNWFFEEVTSEWSPYESKTGLYSLSTVKKDILYNFKYEHLVTIIAVSTAQLVILFLN